MRGSGRGRIGLTVAGRGLDLARASELLSGLVEHSPSVIVLLDREGRIVLCNPSYERVTGLSRQEALGHTPWEVMRNQQQAQVLKMMFDQGGIEGFPPEVELPVDLPDGTGRTVVWTQSVVRNARGGPEWLLAIGLDVTERKRTEDALRRSNRSLEMQRLMSEALARAVDQDYLLSAVCSALVRPGGYGLAWAVVWPNEAAPVVHLEAAAGAGGEQGADQRTLPGEACLTGGPVASVLKTGERQVIVDTSADESFPEWSAAAAAGGWKSCLVLPVTYQGLTLGALAVCSRQETTSSSSEIAMLVTLADDLAYGLTSLRLARDQRRAREELRQERDLLNQIARTSPSGIMVTSPEGALVFANPAAARIVGLDPQDLRAGGNLLTWPLTTLEGRELAEGERPLHRIGRSGEVVRNVRLRARPPSGREVLASVSGAPLQDGQGRTTGMMLIVQDIEEQVRAEQALAESEKRYRTLFEQSPDGVILIDPETQSPIEFNDVVCEQLGYTREELPGLTIASWDAQMGPEEVRRRIASMLESGGDSFASRHRTKTGEIRDVQVKVRVVEIGGKRVLSCILPRCDRVEAGGGGAAPE